MKEFFPAEPKKSELKIIIILSLLAILLTCGIGFLTKKDTSKPTIAHNQTEVDSLNNVIMELKIGNGRTEIILERIWEKDSLIVIEASKNLE